jgi:hypothetical protein
LKELIIIKEQERNLWSLKKKDWEKRRRKRRERIRGGD